jgi:hypothetical protein
MDAVVVKKVMDDAVAMERAATDKKATDNTAAADTTDVDKRATEADMTKKVVDNASLVERATTEAATQSMAESSPALMVGAKRVAASGGSTPPAKRPFHGSWKPRYVERFRCCSSFL